MDNKIILSMELPIVARDLAGKMVTIEPDNNACVVCGFHPENSVYPGDARLVKWYPANFFLNLIYRLKKHRDSNKQM